MTLRSEKLNRIYLDNAATSWPKPETVYAAVDRYQREIGAAAGRGGYRASEDVARVIGRLRHQIADFIGASSPSHIVFTQNCTDSLNLAIHGLLEPGDHVVSSVAEHNSILRPLTAQKASSRIECTLVDVDDAGRVDVEAIRNAMRPKTRLLAITHASNVTGEVQPIDEIAQIAQQHECVFLVDAAQTLAHVPIHVQQSGIDLLAAPGHKGLLGPLGTGLLYVREGLEKSIRPTRQGGTGTQSENAVQPDDMPARFESGNLNVPGLYGLEAGLEFAARLLAETPDHHERLTAGLIKELRQLDGVMVYSSPNPCGIVSFNLAGFDPRELATMLESMAGLELRAGLHCAPMMHQRLGTFESGGCVRASVGFQTRAEDLVAIAEALTVLIENPMT